MLFAKVKKKIKSLAEARSQIREAVAMLADANAFLGRFQGVRDEYAAMVGGEASSFAHSNGGGAGVTIERHPVSDASPLSFVDRVTIIMRDLDRPVMPRDVVAEYQKREWPGPGKGSLYNLVSGTMVYLVRRKHTAQKDKQGYFLTGQRNLPLAGERKAEHKTARTHLPSGIPVTSPG